MSVMGSLNLSNIATHFKEEFDAIACYEAASDTFFD